MPAQTGGNASRQLVCLLGEWVGMLIVVAMARTPSRRTRLKAIFRDYEKTFAPYRSPPQPPPGTQWLYDWYERYLGPQIAEMVNSGSVRRAAYNLISHAQAGAHMHLETAGYDHLSAPRADLLSRLEPLLMEETAEASSTNLENELAEVSVNIVVLSAWVATAQARRWTLVRELRSRGGYSYGHLSRLTYLSRGRIQQIVGV